MSRPTVKELCAVRAALLHKKLHGGVDVEEQRMIDHINRQLERIEIRELAQGRKRYAKRLRTQRPNA